MIASLRRLMLTAAERWMMVEIFCQKGAATSETGVLLTIAFWWISHLITCCVLGVQPPVALKERGIKS